MQFLWSTNHIFDHWHSSKLIITNYTGTEVHIKKVNKTDPDTGARGIPWVIYRAVARTLIGGVHIHVFMFCPTSFFSNQIQISQFEKKSVGQNMNI